jgi:hypothetical protein
MALSKRVSLRGIHREIRAVGRKLRAARRRADKSHHGQLDALTRQLDEMDQKTTAMCGRVYGVWPPPAAPKPPAPKPPAKPPARPPAKPKPGKPKKGGTRPARPKKGGR